MTWGVRARADVHIVVYKDMKAGFLADDTDHGTRELREICKGEPFGQIIDYDTK